MPKGIPKSKDVRMRQVARNKKMVSMAKSGIKRKDIAAHFGVSENSVYVAIRKYWNEI